MDDVVALKRRVAELEALLREKQETIDGLEYHLEELVMSEVRSKEIVKWPFHMTPTQRVVLDLLLQRDAVSKDLIFQTLYGLRPERSQPEIKIVDVMICKVRKT